MQLQQNGKSQFHQPVVQRQYELMDNNVNDNNDDERNLPTGEDRFEIVRELADTLQGRVYGATDKIDGNFVVIKESWKHLIASGTSRSGHQVHENFERERDLLIHLSNQHDCHPGIVRILDAWDDTSCYFYAMEGCKGELFEFIQKADFQRLAQQPKNAVQQLLQNPDEWVRIVRHMFRQLVDCVSWLHLKGVCHMDLSLENTMIYDPQNKIVKVIDFGLAFYSANGVYVNDKRVGKTGYMAPEVYARHRYDPRKADVWSLGVMLFMMLTKAPPYDTPARTDPKFSYIINGRIAEILKAWNRLNWVTVDALDLLSRIFKMENNRISIDQLRRHPFVQLDKFPLFDANQAIVYIDAHEEKNYNQENHFNNNNNNYRHRDNKEGLINDSHVADVKNNDMDSLRDNERNVDVNMSERLDLQNYRFKSNEAIDFVKQILEINQEATINDWTIFVNKIESTINKKAQRQQDLKENAKKNEQDARHNRGQEGNNNRNIEEAQLSLTIKELTLLQQYVTNKIINLQNAKPLSITDSITGKLRHMFNFFFN